MDSTNKKRHPSEFHPVPGITLPQREEEGWVAHQSHPGMPASLLQPKINHKWPKDPCEPAQRCWEAAGVAGPPSSAVTAKRGEEMDISEFPAVAAAGFLWGAFIWKSCSDFFYKYRPRISREGAVLGKIWHALNNNHYY